MEDLIKLAAEKGVCCANCKYSIQKNWLMCDKLRPFKPPWVTLKNSFCADFEPKPTDEK